MGNVCLPMLCLYFRTNLCNASHEGTKSFSAETFMH